MFHFNLRVYAFKGYLEIDFVKTGRQETYGFLEDGFKIKFRGLKISERWNKNKT